MQRSITNKISISTFTYVILFIIYESISSIYLFLPPLFALLFVLFMKALEKKDLFLVLLVSFCLVVFEADKGYLLFSSIIYILTIDRFIVPRLHKNINCEFCIKFIYVVLAYIGFYIFSVLLSNIFLLPISMINYYIIYYIIIEFFIVSLL